MSKPTRFRAEYKPKDTRPDEPILIGRDQSQARVTIPEALTLTREIIRAVLQAKKAVRDARNRL